jgi:Zn-dependent protease with chaperone function
MLLIIRKKPVITVLGHEMAHATSRHSAERLFRSQLTETILGGVQGSIAQMDPGQRQVNIY